MWTTDRLQRLKATRKNETDREILEFWSHYGLQELEDSQEDAKVAEDDDQGGKATHPPEQKPAAASQPTSGFAKPRFESSRPVVRSSVLAEETPGGDGMYKGGVTPKTKGGSWEDLRKEVRTVISPASLRHVSFLDLVSLLEPNCFLV